MPIQELRSKAPHSTWPSWTPPPLTTAPPDILSTTSSKLCTSCQQFFNGPRHVYTGGLKSLLSVFDEHVTIGNEDTNETRPDSNKTERSAILKLCHVNKLRGTVHSARAQACHLCVLIYAEFRKDTRFQTEFSTTFLDSTDLLPPDEYLVRVFIDGGPRNGTFMRVLLTCSDAKCVASVTLWVNAKTNVPMFDTKVDISAAGIVPLGTSTSADMSSQLSRLWLDQCLSSHAKCNKVQSRQRVLPARLLDISEVQSNGRIALRETVELSSDPLDYVTLSHRWGSSDRLRLTQSTLTKFRDGVMVSRLALTFRQAIEIVERLGYRFLWIDCLCIIQDSPNEEDWVNEASKMAEIYGEAVVNIAAAGSSDSDGGCFKERFPFEVQPLRFERYPFPLYEGQDNSGPVLIYSDNVLYKAWDACTGPLDTRGWILQEQLLAPRTLHYSRDQVFWECRELSACEIWPTGVPVTSLDVVHKGQSKVMLDMSKLLPKEVSGGFVADEDDLRGHRWRTTVKMYTARFLTRSEDKLPALSGMASWMQRLAPDDYLAGLWRRSLLQDLAWMVTSEVKPKSWPAQYRSPSWSWAAVDGIIGYDIDTIHTKDSECTIHRARAVPLGQDPLGRVNDGDLEMSGLVRESQWTEASSTHSEIKLADPVDWLNKDIQLFPDVQLSNLPRRVLLFQLFRSFATNQIGSRWGRRRMQGLMLVPVDQQEKIYRRVGFFRAADWGFTEIADNGWGHFVDGWTTARLTVI